jgi:hypothetical protein
MAEMNKGRSGWYVPRPLYLPLPAEGPERPEARKHREIAEAGLKLLGIQLAGDDDGFEFTARSGGPGQPFSFPVRIIAENNAYE